MSVNWEVTEGDKVRLTGTLIDSAGDAVNLTNSTIVFEAVESLCQDIVISGVCTILVAVEGTCYYDLTATDTETPGNYTSTFTATWEEDNKKVTSYPRNIGKVHKRPTTS